MRKIIYKYFMFFTLITLTIINFNKIKLNILSNSIYFMKYVFPSLFIVMIITSIIKLYLTNQNKFMTFIILATSFSPVNACLTNNQDILLYTTIVNPFYTYSAIRLLLNFKKSLVIVLTNLFINYILLLRKIVISSKSIYITNDHKNDDIFMIIKNSINNILYIYGVTMFCSIMISIIPDISIITYLKVFIDITSGFSLIRTLKHQSILITLLNSFTGLSIIFQERSLNNKIDGKFILRKLTISIIIFIITITILYLVI